MCCYIAVALALLATVGPTVSRTTLSTSVSSDAPSNTDIMATTRSNVDPATAMQVGISQPVLSMESGQTYCCRAGPIQSSPRDCKKERNSYHKCSQKNSSNGWIAKKKRSEEYRDMLREYGPFRDLFN
ncbi:hypothetical protein BC835DRAFT_1304260 [Cytidiella melzeri]|nr:hypothetical protein BC835DRAFT_1304260 [Cytidiella melzeri]